MTKCFFFDTKLKAFWKITSYNPARELAKACEINQVFLPARDSLGNHKYFSQYFKPRTVYWEVHDRIMWLMVFMVQTHWGSYQAVVYIRASAWAQWCTACEELQSCRPSLRHWELTEKAVILRHQAVLWYMPFPTVCLMKPPWRSWGGPKLYLSKAPGESQFSFGACQIIPHELSNSLSGVVDDLIPCDDQLTPLSGLTHLDLHRSTDVLHHPPVWMLQYIRAAVKGQQRPDYTRCGNFLSDLNGLAAVSRSCPKLKILNLISSRRECVECVEKLWEIMASRRT